MDPMAVMQIKVLLDQFKSNHPKVPMFFKAAAHNITEGSIIEINVTSPNGEKLCTNMKISEDDLKLFDQIKMLSL